ncbi:exodeoxyribonuclease III [Murdochiella massiliensis]|uniref:exodeoxyribonuclease III n=1 Tax=Murdochiella massiliensis TaxID=1673723 RepID=UPI0018D41B8E|nr:exodeoxyribonuclease III [Murdochiella massiliensis]
MKLMSWNVNGLRAQVRKGFLDKLEELNPDILCMQEIKLSEGQLTLDLPDYEQYYNYAERKGYSGTAIFTKTAPLSVQYGIGIAEHDDEGRVITMEFPSFYLVTVYTPNSKRGLERLDYRQVWEDAFLAYLKKLEETHPVVVCGDLNVAHREIDLANPSTNRKNAGFTDEERAKFNQLLDHGFIDTFRYFYPDRTEAYTWWSNFAKSRERNIGWRIDYFLVSQALEKRLVSAAIHDDVMGSDHCPVELVLSLQ